MDGTKKRENKSLEFLEDTDFLNQPYNAITKTRDVQGIFSLRYQCECWQHIPNLHGV